ncbi:MAG: DNA alkylation repair protein [Candidatus Moranbacteria bacterium]|nr:DNA alkylation repair protein [Candidatus Moranbacteria bacterium]
MNQQRLIQSIQQELTQNIDKKYLKVSRTFFKEETNSLGVQTPIVRKISAKYYRGVKNLDKKDIWGICEKLLKREGEFKMIAFDWAFKQRNAFTKNDFRVFENWYKKYVSNWGSCDNFCTHALGYLIYQFPELTAKTKKWSRSKNRWFRRASAVVLIYSLRKDNLLKEAFQISNTLLEDSDDLVQKGYGWMLKEAANIQETKIFKYVIENKKKMPRTALRYAIEKMPSKLKKEAMTI